MFSWLPSYCILYAKVPSKASENGMNRRCCHRCLSTSAINVEKRKTVGVAAPPDQHHSKAQRSINSVSCWVRQQGNNPQHIAHSSTLQTNKLQVLTVNRWPTTCNDWRHRWASDTKKMSRHTCPNPREPALQRDLAACFLGPRTLDRGGDSSCRRGKKMILLVINRDGGEKGLHKMFGESLQI